MRANGASDARGRPGTRVAWRATLAAKRGGALRADHLRYRPQTGAPGALHCFVLDCSASMLTAGRLARAKGLVVALFDRIARERADAALVCFGGGSADVRFGPAVPRWWNERWLAPVGGGGGTPLAQGIDAAARLLARAARRRPRQQRWLWVLSDGRTNEAPARPAHVDRIVVVDFDDAPVRLGRCERLAHAWDAARVAPEDLARA
ncbi:vWA domain-containing protein [Burkholderia mayonis]|uniref:Magnesium chelatase n=1 Tax=Burkholderia mayonis TaxID=1385591 RepID=A0A1B4G2U4_9BURK|nr:VWA domain-containing protein [Burkholderia mayonis]AOJ10259.1 magnesium chelatase [Burkholderia mayonis]KVE53759.1 magnesium chelatase [Burkholderia mayonis]